MNALRYEHSKRIYSDHHERGLTYAEIARRERITRSQVAGMIRDFKAVEGITDVSSEPVADNGLITEIQRLRAEISELHTLLDEHEEDALYGHNLGKAWELHGDFVIVGDIHVSTTNWSFAQRPLQIAMKYLDKPRRLIIAGDMINADAFSKYDSAVPLPSFATELKAARHFINKYLEVFDEIYLFLGNHDRRVQLRTNSAIAPEDLLRLISHDTRVKISHWGHCVVDSPTGKWRILHGSEYSVNQLVIADQLAQKYGMHVIGHHQHHLAVGWSRYKQYVVVDNGGLFDQASMAYVMLDDNKKPRMANGFTLLKKGTPYLFGSEPFTDYNYWLGQSNVIHLEEVA